MAPRADGSGASTSHEWRFHNRFIYMYNISVFLKLYILNGFRRDLIVLLHLAAPASVSAAVTTKAWAGLKHARLGLMRMLRISLNPRGLRQEAKLYGLPACVQVVPQHASLHSAAVAAAFVAPQMHTSPFAMPQITYLQDFKVVSNKGTVNLVKSQEQLHLTRVWLCFLASTLHRVLADQLAIKCIDQNHLRPCRLGFRRNSKAATVSAPAGICHRD